MESIRENALKSKPRTRVRMSDNPHKTRRTVAAQPGEGAMRRQVQAVQDGTRTPVQKQRAKAGRAAAENKARRSEAWWNARFLGTEYNFFYRNFLSRCLRSRLTPTEWAVLDFIFDRTLGWDKEWERISVRQFLGGSKPDVQGFQAFCGVGIQSETTLRKTLDRLCAEKLIKVREHAGGYRSFALIHLDHLAAEIAQWNLPSGHEIRYRAKWPKSDNYVEICSNIQQNQ